MENVYVIEPKTEAKACVIWMHGLGADAHDMAGLAEHLPLQEPVRHVCLDAPVRPVTVNQNMSMRAWYDIVGTELSSREDRAGILQSDTLIRGVIAQQMQKGLSSKQIYLAGFSQGGAMALFTGLQSTLPLGGIVALSAYLPLATECKANVDRQTPIFLSFGLQDLIVLPKWTKQSAAFLQEQGYKNVSMHQYNMGHNICAEEAFELTRWFMTQLTGALSSLGEV